MRGRRSAVLLALATLALAAVLPARAEDPLDALLQRARKAVTRAQTLQGDLEMTDQGQRLTGKLALKRPNLARMELKGPELEVLVVSDGTRYYWYLPKTNEYYHGEPGGSGGDIMSPVPSGDMMMVFFQPQRLDPQALLARGSEWRYGGNQRVDGEECEVADWIHNVGPFRVTFRFFIATKNDLVRRVDTINPRPDGDLVATLILKNARVDAPVADTAFRWSPPAGATAHPLPKSGEPFRQQ